MAVVEELALGDLVLIGHSMGGDVIVEAALRLPDQVVGIAAGGRRARAGR